MTRSESIGHVGLTMAGSCYDWPRNTFAIFETSFFRPRVRGLDRRYFMLAVKLRVDTFTQLSHFSGLDIRQKGQRASKELSCVRSGFIFYCLCCFRSIDWY